MTIRHNDSNDGHDDFIRLFSRHEGSVRAFVTSLLPSFEGVDEVMQEASLAMWKKFEQFDPDRPGSKFIDWAFMIARYEVLRYRRSKATDRLLFTEDVLELLATEAEELATDQPLRHRALQDCLGRLQVSQLELIRVAYADGVSIQDAAGKVGRTPTASIRHWLVSASICDRALNRRLLDNRRRDRDEPRRTCTRIG